MKFLSKCLFIIIFYLLQKFDMSTYFEHIHKTMDINLGCKDRKVSGSKTNESKNDEKTFLFSEQFGWIWIISLTAWNVPWFIPFATLLRSFAVSAWNCVRWQRDGNKKFCGQWISRNEIENNCQKELSTQKESKYLFRLGCMRVGYVEKINAFFRLNFHFDLLLYSLLLFILILFIFIAWSLHIVQTEWMIVRILKH